MLSRAEADSVLAAAKEAAASTKVLIAGTGAESTAETVARTRRAAELGYAAALVKPLITTSPFTRPKPTFAISVPSRTLRRFPFSFIPSHSSRVLPLRPLKSSHSPRIRTLSESKTVPATSSASPKLLPARLQTFRCSPAEQRSFTRPLPLVREVPFWR